MQDVERDQAHEPTLRRAPGDYGDPVFKALFCSMLIFVMIAALGMWLRRTGRR
jgi:hypothetical protein